MFIIAFGLTLLFSSCAKSLYVNYQTDSTNTGTIVLKPTKPTIKTFVTINDNLIIEKKRVKSVTINNIPNGKYNIHYTSDNRWYKEKLDTAESIKMESGKTITKLVEVPPYSNGYYVYNGFVFVGSIALWMLILL